MCVFSAPKVATPAPVAQPSTAPQQSDGTVSAARESERRRRLTGQATTQLTGQNGLLAPANTAVSQVG